MEWIEGERERVREREENGRAVDDLSVVFDASLGRLKRRGNLLRAEQ